MLSMSIPLAERLRPRTLDEYIGQAHLVGQNGVFRKFLETGNVPSFILWGPPGVGKTTLAIAFSKVLGLDYQRIQFTPDVMPADIAGFSVYKQGSESFEYQKGAAITNLLLADEINRTSPKTQSALLEAMEEGRITVDGVTRELPDPYVVIATQNPLGAVGTHSLPEAQLDRFMIRISMGYPDRESEVAMLKQERVNVAIDSLEEIIQVTDLILMKQQAERIYVHEDLYRYIVDLVCATRNHPDLSMGISPRGTISLLQMAKANAYLDDRDYMVPDDIKQIFYAASAHRVMKSKEARIKRRTVREILTSIAEEIPVPESR